MDFADSDDAAESLHHVAVLGEKLGMEAASFAHAASALALKEAGCPRDVHLGGCIVHRGRPKQGLYP